MKRYLSLMLFVALFAACTKDVEENFENNFTPEQLAAYEKIAGSAEGANDGMLILKVTPEVADLIEAGVTRSGGTRSGIETMDTRLSAIRAERFQQVFPTDPLYAEQERAFGLHLWYYVTFDKSQDLTEAARILSMEEGISSVTFDYEICMVDGASSPLQIGFDATRATTEHPCNDPMLPQQWHYYNDGTGPDKAVAGADINLYEAWKICKGDAAPQEIVVAVVDQPVQYTHPDLAANMWVNPNKNEVGLEHGACFVYSTSDTSGDLNGTEAIPLNWDRSTVFTPGGSVNYYEYLDHGTHVAGTIAAVNDNNEGVAGIAGGGGVKLMSCQWSVPVNRFGQASTDPLGTARALRWAANRNAVIAQNSWGYGSPMTDEAFRAQPICAAIDYFIQHGGKNSPLNGGLLIFAAGNDGMSNRGAARLYPAAYSKVIAVAAMQPDFKPSYFTDYGDWVDIVAPGGSYICSTVENNYYGDDGQVLSTVLDPETSGAFGIKNDRSTGYAWMQGTSMACPHVSGIAALGLVYASKLGKSFTVEQYKNLIISSTHPIEPYLTGTIKGYNGQGFVDLDATEYKNMLGAGYIDAALFLANIAGTPTIMLPADSASSKVEVGKVLGGAGVRSCTVTVPDDVKARLGLKSFSSTAPKGVWTVTCTKPGSAFVTVSASIGGTTIEQQVLLVAKSTVTSNGGWF